MTLSEYQEFTKETAVYPSIGNNIVYPSIGLANETGEYLGKVKKYLRGDPGKDMNNPEFKASLAAELGDCLWYLARCADELGYSLDTIMQENYNKLCKRKEDGVLKGDGDNR